MRRSESIESDLSLRDETGSGSGEGGRPADAAMHADDTDETTEPAELRRRPAALLRRRRVGSCEPWRANPDCARADGAVLMVRC